MIGKSEHGRFTVIVAGDNPDELMQDYDLNLKVEPYVVYKFKDAHNLQLKYIDFYQKLIEIEEDEDEKNILLEHLQTIKNQDVLDFYTDITLDYDYDPETGNAISTQNPNGKWSSYRIGNLFSVPFKDKNGNELFTCQMKDVDWGKTHMANKHIYEAAWDIVINNKTPETDEEKIIYNNMKERKGYFLSFDNKENYVINNIAFWAQAFLSKNTGWIEMPDNVKKDTWVSEYYDRFIKNLSLNTKLTIFECVK